MKLTTALEIAQGQREATEVEKQWAMNVMAGWIIRERAFKNKES